MSRIHSRPARSLQVLLLSASTLAIANPAWAAQVVFSTDRELEVETGERVSQARGLTQVRLDSGAMASFVDSADYRLNADGSIDLYAGSVTVAGSEASETVVQMPGGVEGRVANGAAGSFTVTAEGQSRGHALTGNISIVRAGNLRTFDAGEMWAADSERLRQVVSNGAAPAPAAAQDGAEIQVADMEQGGPLAAAANGLPVSLGDALAAAGASGDVLAAARRVEMAAANPDLTAFPSGDLALLVSYSAQLQSAYSGQAFPGAQPDIIRTYLGFLADGGSGADFLGTYSAILVQYLDLLRAGALPSAFTGASRADLDAFIGYSARISGFGGLAAENRALIDAYLTFLSGGGNPELFARSYTDLVDAYFAYLRTGGDPATFTGATQTTLNAYIAFLDESGLLTQLSAADRALLQAYVANGGFAFADQYRAALDSYFAYLSAGNLPSSYDAIDAATLRTYLETLQAAGLFERVLGARAQFFAGYLGHLQAGGAIDGYQGLNANVFAGYAARLGDFYAFLQAGGLPNGYDGNVEALFAHLGALEEAGALETFLGARASFYADYLAFVEGGGDANLFAQLPGLNLDSFADALNAYAAFLQGGGLPSGYTTTELAALGDYIEILQNSGRLGELLGANADILSAYFAHLASGGAADRFAGLPVYAGYVTALNDYYAFLADGGLPGDYTALTQAQINAYLAALQMAGGLASYGNLQAFFADYVAFVSAGGDPVNYAGLPVYADYVAALNAYHAFLADGGLPEDYTVLTPAQIEAYLDALQAAGGLASYSHLQGFFADYLAFVEAGGNPANYAGLPIYADYVAALNAYYAFLASGGLPADYTALTEEQIDSYLTALASAGGLSAHGALQDFFTAYYAHIAAGGTSDTFAALPAYQGYLAALQAYYDYLAGGGLPSGYTALTQAQVESYLAVLAQHGILQASVSDEVFQFLTDYLAFVQNEANDPDGFAQLPVNDPGISLASGANVWIFSNEGGRIGIATTADVTNDGQIVRTDYTTGSGTVSFDYTGEGNTLREHGRVGDAVAWTRYEHGAAFNVSNANSHLLLGSPATNLPADGTIEYKLIGGTAPTDSLAPVGEIGAFSGNLAVAFGSAPRVGLDFDVHVGTRGWHAETSGGAAGAASGGLTVDGTMSFSSQNLQKSGIAGDACTGYCNVSVFGGLFGSGATSGGFQYHIDDQSGGQSNRSYVNGVAVFGTDGDELAMIGTMPEQPGQGTGPGDPIVRGTDDPGEFASSGAALIFAGVFGGQQGIQGYDGRNYNADGSTSYTLDAQGLVTVTGGPYQIARETADALEVYGNERLLIGRWSDGAYSDANLSADQGVHYLLVAPLSEPLFLPTGTVRYNQIAATAPTSLKGLVGPGAFNADLAIAFGAAPKAGIEGTIVTGGEDTYTYTFATQGGVETPGVNLSVTEQGFLSFGASGTTDHGQAGSISFWGGMADVQASQLGLNYRASLFNNNGSGAFSDSLGGSVLFGRADLYDEVVATVPVSNVDPDPEPQRAPTGNFANATVTTDVFVSDGHLVSYDYRYANPNRSDSIDPFQVSGTAEGGYKTDADGRVIELFRASGWRDFVDPAAFGSGSGQIAANVDEGRTASGAVRWSRWSDGRVGNYYFGDPPDYVANANQGYHIVIGTPATDLPASGRVNYDLAGGTRPTDVAGNIAPGTLVSGAAAVQFGTETKVGIDLAFDFDNQRFNAKTTGGLADLASSELTLLNGGFVGASPAGSVTSDGATCSGAATCSVAWTGFLAGSQGSEMGVQYDVSFGSQVSVIGAAAFTKQAPSNNPYASLPDGTAAAENWDRWQGLGLTAAGEARVGTPGLGALAATGITYTPEQLQLLHAHITGGRNP